jgi:hypothetical protein
MSSHTSKIIVAAVLLSPVLALAAVPSTVGFAARVADNGQPVTGTKSFTFKLWNVSTGGTEGTDDIWIEGPRNIAVNDGVVATVLGDVANGGTALPAFNNTLPLWLEVTMGSTTFSPRIALQSVPYAFRAAVADSIGCQTITATTAINTGTTADVVASCPAGTTATGGGYYAYWCLFIFGFCFPQYTNVSLLFQNTGNEFQETFASNSSGTNLTLVSFVRCCGTP